MDQQQQQQGDEVVSDGEEVEEEEEEAEGDGVEAMSQEMIDCLNVGNILEVRRLLDDGEDINCYDPSFMTPVLVALSKCFLHIVQMLADRGADLSRRDDLGTNLLQCAAIGGDRDCIEWVLANTSIDVESSDGNGATSLLLSCTKSAGWRKVPC
jgi:ankyrin repeat protein